MVQRSGIDTIKYHTWPRIPMGKWQTHRRHHKREPRGQPFPSRWPQSTYKQTRTKHSKHKTEQKHKRSTSLFQPLSIYKSFLICEPFLINCGSLIFYFLLAFTSSLILILMACWVIFHIFFDRLLTFFKIIFFKKFLQESFQSVKWFGSRAGPTECRAWSGSKLFAKIISRWQNSLLAGKN